MEVPPKAPTMPHSENVPDFPPTLENLERLKQELEIFVRSIPTQDQVNQNLFNIFRDKVENLKIFAIRVRLIPQRHTAEVAFIKNLIFLCSKCFQIIYFEQGENEVYFKLNKRNEEFITQNCDLQKEWVKEFENNKISLEDNITISNVRQNQIIGEGFNQFIRALEDLVSFARKIQTSGPANYLEDYGGLATPLIQIYQQFPQRLQEELFHARDITLELCISNEFQLIAERLESQLFRFRRLQQVHQHHLTTFLDGLREINNIIRNRLLIIQQQPME